MPYFVCCLTRLTLVLSLLMLSITAHSFTLSNGEHVSCSITHEGKLGVATEIWSNYTDVKDRHPELGRAVAVMRLDDKGWPTIIMDEQAYQRTAKGSPTLWDFVYFHECAHAQQPALTEIEANCESYLTLDKRGLMNYQKMKELESFHFAMINLPMEYGGTGAQFWHQTMQCVRKARDQ